MVEQFIDLCREGELDDVKQFLKYHPNMDNVNAFRYACEYGHLEVAQWLLQVKPDINISAQNEWAFCIACFKGYLEVAQWLLSVKPDINISAQDDQAFRGACRYGHLEVAKWLLQVKPDINISAEDDKAFYWACNCGYLDIAKWLQSLKPYLYVIEYDENGKYNGFKIRRKEEANWEKRKCALHLALQEETNILYHLPIDIAKAVTLFV